MAGDIAKLLASLDLDTRPFSRGAGRVSGDLSKMEGGLGRVSTRAIALGSAVGVGIERLAEKGISVLFDSIRSGEDALRTLQTAQAQTAAVIESTGGKAGVTAQQVRDLAESIESLTTADDKTIQQGENLLLTFTNIGSKVFPDATKAMVNMAIALNKGNAETADFDGAAIQLGKALNDPIKGITALRRVGVSFSEQQQKQIKDLVKHGKLQEAQAVILKELTTEFGKAGEAAGKSGAAGLVRFHDAIEDSQIALATGLAPALEEIRGELTKGLNDPGTQKAIRDLGVFLGDAAKSGLAFAKSVPWGQIADGLKTAGHFAGELFKVFANLPPGVQATIIGLGALNKLGGGGVIKIGVDLFKEGAKGLLGQFVSRGSPTNPMFVVAEGGLGGAGVPSGGVVGTAKGGLSALSKLFLVGEAIGLITAVNEVRDNISAASTKQAQDISDSLDKNLSQNPQTLTSLTTQLNAINSGITDLTSNPLNVLVQGDALTTLESMRDKVTQAIKDLQKDAADKGDKLSKRQEHHTAAIADQHERLLLKNVQKQDEAKAKLEAAKAAIDRGRDAVETARIAQVSAQKTGAAQIVDAIDRSQPKVTVNVTVKDGQVSTSYETGGNIGGGGGRRIKP